MTASNIADWFYWPSATMFLYLKNFKSQSLLDIKMFFACWMAGHSCERQSGLSDFKSHFCLKHNRVLKWYLVMVILNNKVAAINIMCVSRLTRRATVFITILSVLPHEHYMAQDHLKKVEINSIQRINKLFKLSGHCPL